MVSLSKAFTEKTVKPYTLKSLAGGRVLSKVEVYGLKVKEEIKPGFDLAEAIVREAERQAGGLKDGDVVVVTSKVVSKAEGRLASLNTVKPSPFAERLAASLGKPAEVVELVLREASRIVRMGKRVLITEDLRGWISANSGVDVSNAPPGYAILLPIDPDASARKLRDALSKATGKEVAVIVSDTQGRPFRKGQVDVAVGLAGLKPIWDRKGEKDLYGYSLRIKEIALADELASAAELVIGQAAEATPVAIIRGVSYEKDEKAEAKDLQRPRPEDLFA
ncbi:MAG: coenzyme F420-0:L-glutamate ligase [Thermoprotei archaeon]|nr:MAG: coenzyme F420-0:L-glutamate ligase [Thermoprotei archaeon]RLF18008.1 MAG: coenzyme F420-0:L-glutamate ligase [Thermoprotei archaeon]